MGDIQEPSAKPPIQQLMPQVRIYSAFWPAATISGGLSMPRAQHRPSQLKRVGVPLSAASTGFKIVLGRALGRCSLGEDARHCIKIVCRTRPKSCK